MMIIGSGIISKRLSLNFEFIGQKNVVKVKKALTS